jgi:TatD DNase family protein
LQIRRLAAEMPLEALVLETDAPDIAPAWLHPERNSPEQLPAIGKILAELRNLSEHATLLATGTNTTQVLPRLQSLLAPGGKFENKLKKR